MRSASFLHVISAVDSKSVSPPGSVLVSRVPVERLIRIEGVRGWRRGLVGGSATMSLRTSPSLRTAESDEREGCALLRIALSNTLDFGAVSMGVSVTSDRAWSKTDGTITLTSALFRESSPMSRLLGIGRARGIPRRLIERSRSTSPTYRTETPDGRTLYFWPETQNARNDECRYNEELTRDIWAVRRDADGSSRSR